MNEDNKQVKRVKDLDDLDGGTTDQRQTNLYERGIKPALEEEVLDNTFERLEVEK